MRRLPTIALAISAAIPGAFAQAAAPTDKDDKPVMLRQPASTDTLPSIDPNRFGDKPADEAFGAFQRGLYLTALNLALPRAEKGDAAAQVLAAEIYARGLGVPINQTEAARWYGRAADLGVIEAQFRYGAMLLQGKYVPRDKAKAEKLMKAAAEAGNRMAQFNYGQLMMVNHPGEAGLDEAFPWFLKAAQAKLADGEYAVSQIYANGTLKIPRDDKKAREFLERAAKQNYDTAQLDLATWYIEGRGGPRDYKAGFRWMHRAAMTGNVAAQARLARLYRDGIGTEGDFIEAAAWYIIARRAGLAAYDLDSFMDGLAEDQIKQAMTRANNLR
ncbi:sel1 repeat family protein [Phyllobacterium salinisoli]|uniref:Sel1 repeat family protein n=1 Tax=Phyllobacterium salinisoli TaxID=1899321 RepID=A0A368K3T6_9HYPH|nr:tetratricopeptide repeat protein [Phyllobacterium salinisoli]RCS24039.1 sel1 repeat family protein [Phyllobacterium salinisoli]